MDYEGLERRDRNSSAFVLEEIFERRLALGCPPLPELLKCLVCALARLATVFDLPGEVAHVDHPKQTVAPTVQTAVDNILTSDAAPVGVSVREPSIERLIQLHHENFMGETKTHAARQVLVKAAQHRLIRFDERRLDLVDGQIRANDQLQLDQPIDPVERLQPEIVCVWFLSRHTGSSFFAISLRTI